MLKVTFLFLCTFRLTMVRSGRPPYPYAGIVIHALHSSPDQQMTLGQIRQYMTEKFPSVFRSNARGWKDSVRTSLTSNNCFSVSELCESNGVRKSRYWKVDLSLVTKNVFKRHPYKTVAEEKWPSELHAYLGVASIDLPACVQTSVEHSDDKLSVDSASDESCEPVPKRRKVVESVSVEVQTDPLDHELSSSDKSSSCSMSSTFDSSIEAPRCETSYCELSVMNSTRIDPDASVDAFDAPCSPIEPEPEPELSSEDLIQGSLCLLDMMSGGSFSTDRLNPTAATSDDISSIVPSLFPSTIPTLDEMMEYITSLDMHSVSFSDICLDDFRTSV